jgi:hypothetical protein
LKTEAQTSERHLRTSWCNSASPDSYTCASILGMRVGLIAARESEPLPILITSARSRTATHDAPRITKTVQAGGMRRGTTARFPVSS